MRGARYPAAAAAESRPGVVRYTGLDAPGCPLCRAARDAEDRFIRWLLIELYHSIATLIRLERTRLCERHAAVLLSGEHPQLSVTFEFLSRSELRNLLEFETRPGRTNRRRLWWRHWRARRLPGATPSDPRGSGCPVCEAGAVAAAGEVYRILDFLATTEGRHAYEQHDGLCRVHLWMVLREAPDDLARWLAADARRRISDMLAAFAVYFRRLDYRYRHEPKGDEQTAWRRALRFFWGDVAVGPPDGSEACP